MVAEINISVQIYRENNVLVKVHERQRTLIHTIYTYAVAKNDNEGDGKFEIHF